MVLVVGGLPTISSAGHRLNGVDLWGNPLRTYHVRRTFLTMSTPTQTDPAHAERSHHPTSPSSLQTLEASPCFLNRDESSEAAERGTKQHEAADSGEDDHELTDAEALAVAATETAVDEAVVRLGPDATTIREDYWPVDRRLIPDSTGKKWR